MIQFPEFPASKPTDSAAGNTQPALIFMRQYRDLPDMSERGRGGANDIASRHSPGRQVGKAAPTPFIQAHRVSSLAASSSVTRSTAVSQ
jgi:hypothetical protein